MISRTNVLRIAGLLCFSLFVAPVARAQTLKIGYIDLQRLVFDTKVGKAGVEDIKKFQEARQKEISDKEKALLEMRKNLETQSGVLSEDAKKVLLDKATAAEISLKRLLEDSDRELREKRNLLLERINKEIGEIIILVGKEKGFSMILEKDATVLYADPALDVTSLIIERYDKTAKP